MSGTATLDETAAHTEISRLAGKYLTFKLDAEEFGIEILKVQEIIKMMDITKVPRMPEFIRGVLNLRGKVIPVTDLRLKFTMDIKETTDKTCVVVVQVKHGALPTGSGQAGKVTMGIIVDEVSEVLDIDGAQLEPPPEFGASVDTEFILAIGKVGKKVIMLLDVDCVLSSEEIHQLGRI